MDTCQDLYTNSADKAVVITYEGEWVGGGGLLVDLPTYW